MRKQMCYVAGEGATQKTFAALPEAQAWEIECLLTAATEKEKPTFPGQWAQIILKNGDAIVAAITGKQRRKSKKNAAATAPGDKPKRTRKPKVIAPQLSLLNETTPAGALQSQAAAHPLAQTQLAGQ